MVMRTLQSPRRYSRGLLGGAASATAVASAVTKPRRPLLGCLLATSTSAFALWRTGGTLCRQPLPRRLVPRATSLLATFFAALASPGDMTRASRAGPWAAPPNLSEEGSPAGLASTGVDELLLPHNRCGSRVALLSRRSWSSRSWWRRVTQLLPPVQRTVYIHMPSGWMPCFALWDSFDPAWFPTRQGLSRPYRRQVNLRYNKSTAGRY